MKKAQLAKTLMKQQSPIILYYRNNDKKIILSYRNNKKNYL